MAHPVFYLGLQAWFWKTYHILPRSAFPSYANPTTIESKALMRAFLRCAQHIGPPLVGPFPETLVQRIIFGASVYTSDYSCDGSYYNCNSKK
eukprot:5843472-Amphidinium_carterae.3